MLNIRCDRCGKRYEIDESSSDRPIQTLQCNACGHLISVAKTLVDPDALQPEVKEPDPMPKLTPAPAPAIPDKKPVRFGLLAKFITAMLVVGLLPFGVFVGVTMTETRTRTRNDTEQLMHQIADGLGSQVDEWIGQNTRALESAATMPAMIGMNPSDQVPILKSIQHAYNYMYLVFTLDTKGMNIARNDGKALRNYADRQYYKDVMAGKPLAWETLIGKTSHKPALVMAVPIKRDGKIVGVLATAMTIDAISKFVANWHRGKTGFAFLVDETGKVVAHQIKAYVTTQKNLSSNPLVQAYHKARRDTAVTFTDENGNAQVGYVRGNAMGWVLAVQQSAAEVYAPYHKDQRLAVIIVVVTVLVILIFAFLIGKTLVGPINRLIDAADRMSMGDLDIQVSVDSKDEIGQLAQAINRMQISLSMAIDRLRKRSRSGG